jgi:site-specific DNA-methyltransferase (adenine-specific)
MTEDANISIAMAKRIELWPFERLRPYERNARTHSVEQVAQIAASIVEFGFTNPILVDSHDGIIAGHGRLMAAQELGLKTVPVVVLDHLSERQRKAYILADNQLALNAAWDTDLLREELQDLAEQDFDLTLIGFSDDELADLLPDIEELPPEDADADAVPEPPVDPVSKPGDVWLLGKHRVMCGDSTDPIAMERLMEDKPADLWLTDPPYNVALGMNESPEEAKKRNRRTDGKVVKNDSMPDAAFRQFLVDVYTTANCFLRPGGVFCIWHADSEGYNFRGAAHDIGWKIRQCLIWKKSSLVMGRQDYQWMHEPCLYGWTDGSGHYLSSDRKQTTVMDFAKPSRNGEHPTMKPVDLFEYQMANSSKPGDVVLDSFGGSGTTMIAAERLGRKARLMELDPAYCDVIVNRWQQFTGKTATLESTGEPFPVAE